MSIYPSVTAVPTIRFGRRVTTHWFFRPTISSAYRFNLLRAIVLCRLSSVILLVCLSSVLRIIPSIPRRDHIHNTPLRLQYRRF